MDTKKKSNEQNNRDYYDNSCDSIDSDIEAMTNLSKRQKITLTKNRRSI